MNDTAKTKSLIFLGLTLLAVILIAVGLPGLELLPGVPLPDWEAGSAAVPLGSNPLPRLSVNTFAMAVLGFFLGSTLLYLGYRLIQGASWKQMFSSFRFAAVLVLVVSVVIFLLFAVGRVHLTPADAALEIPQVALPRNGPPLGSLSSLLIWLAWVGLALVIALLVVWIVLWQSRRRRNSDPLSAQVERALQALKSGESFKNVIVRCYTELSLVLQREQGLGLEETMTAQEFKRLLEARGIPHTPIDQLTRLFEAARYGYRPPTAADEQAAYDSLNSIVSHIRIQKKVR
jgi:lysylphosphatidylglycerol synthetase-like protein (DUF2156 family)